MKMEQIECSETSAYKIQTPGNHPEENIQQIQMNFDSYLMPYCVTRFDLTWPQYDNLFSNKFLNKECKIENIFFYVFSQLVSSILITIELKTLKSFLNFKTFWIRMRAQPYLRIWLSNA
jgi:hypothetical protein